MKTHSMIEPLEPRIAPAIVFTFTEFDGDLVTVTISKGNAGDATFTHPPVPGWFGDQLATIDLNGNQVFQGANITVTARPQDLNGTGLIRGDGLANVGFIDASGIDLGTVKITGDLAKILAGDATLTTPGLKSLQVLSLGLFGTDTGAPNTISTVQGKLTKIAVTTDLASSLNADSVGSATIGVGLSGNLSSGGDMGLVKIGGDLSGNLSVDGKLAGATIGGSFTTGSGRILSGGDMGLVRIAGDLRVTGNSVGGIHASGNLAGVKIGGSFISEINAGSISTGGNMGLIEIRGDIRGGTNGGAVIASGGKLAGAKIGGSVIGGGIGPASGLIASDGDMGSIQINGSLVGGEGDESGRIASGGKLAKVTIGGSIVGGPGDFSGTLFSAGDMGVVKIAGDLRGGTPLNGANPSIDGSGYIEGARIASISIGGSIVAGRDFNPGDAPTKNASIRAHDDIGSLTVKGSLLGNTNGDDVNVIISARGQRDLGATATTDVAIGKINIGGGTNFAQILAGYDVQLTGRNADAQIGAVIIGGTAERTNIIAGVQDGGDGFGNFNDAKLSGIGVFKDNTDGLGAVSKIASVVIKGYALGTLSLVDGATFAIAAQHLSSVKIGGAKIPLKAGVGNDLLADAFPLGPTRITTGDGFDFHAFEVPIT